MGTLDYFNFTSYIDYRTMIFCNQITIEKISLFHLLNYLIACRCCGANITIAVVPHVLGAVVHNIIAITAMHTNSCKIIANCNLVKSNSYQSPILLQFSAVRYHI